MEQVEDGNELLNPDEWQEIVMGMFEDIFEQHGLGYAVSMFLAALGQWAVETDTLEALEMSMNGCLDLAAEMLDTVEPVSIN